MTTDAATHTYANRGTIAVTGATGFIGHHVVKQALASGWTVKALVRDYAKADKVLPTDPQLHGGRLSLVKGDALDVGVLDQLVAGVTGVINCTGIIREARGGQTFKRMHVGATDALLNAAERNNVKRYVQMSAAGVSDEGVNEYQQSKFAAEKRVRASNLDWTILRPSMVHGPKGDYIRMAAAMAQGKAQPFVVLPYFVRTRAVDSVPGGAGRWEEPVIAPVFVGDVARCAVESVTNEAAIGEIIHLAGPETLYWYEMLTTIRNNVPHANRKMPVIGIPADIAAIKVEAAKYIGLGSVLPFDAGMAKMAAEDNAPDTAKAHAIFGGSFADFSTTFADYASAIEPAA
ncbi:MAG: NAD(P)H-binding protein [Phycisphaeraceae bacterium]|nr:NAD(P)H-binding protein [Phycisphaerales bacterium]MCB9859489.1 NAD(P)H-binding protein [Phycisphaeraceae bacterium]